jgi:hypothetical protein
LDLVEGGLRGVPTVRTRKPEKDEERINRAGHKAADGSATDQAAPLSMYEEYKEPLYAAPPLLQRMVDAGRLGRKSGSGFYAYA